MKVQELSHDTMEAWILDAHEHEQTGRVDGG